MAEIELDFTDEELFDVVKTISRDFSEESKSFLVEGSPDEQFESLGRSVFNEHIIKAVRMVLENDKLG